MKIIKNMYCPFCGDWVKYWPNYSRNTSSDYGNVEWVQTRSGTKQYFHRSCYLRHVAEQKATREKQAAL